MTSPTPGRRSGPGCGLAAVLVVIVVGGVAAVLLAVGSDLAARDEEEEPRPIVLQISVEDAAGGRADGDYVLELGRHDADELGVPRSVPSEFGTFKLRTATELAPRSTYTYCLEEEAAVTRDGAEVGVVPAGTCMAGGGSNRTPAVRVPT